MADTVLDYWREYADQIEEAQHVDVIGPDRNLAEIGLIDGDESYGIIDAVIFFDDDVYLGVHERVTMTVDKNGAPSRLEYAYQLVVRDVPIGRWYHDPRFVDPDMRAHFDDDLAAASYRRAAARLRLDGVNVEFDRPDEHRSLKEVVDLCWTIIDNVKQKIDSGEIG